tara:strand:- start:50 stop:565 length:516 start_codon:yes stop_codon:yes gene_type:complete
MTMNEQQFREGLKHHYDYVAQMQKECRSLLAEHSFEERTNISLEKCKVGDTGGFCTALFIPSHTEKITYNVTNGDCSADLADAISTSNQYPDFGMFIALEDSSHKGWESALGEIFHDVQCGFEEIRKDDLKEIGITTTDVQARLKTIEEIVAHIVRVEERLKDAKLPKENQ